MANNVFDEHFKNRLEAFQRDHGLAVDGTLTAEVWTKLGEVAATAPEPVAEPAPEPVAETVSEPVTAAAVAVPVASVAITAEEYPLLTRFAALCVDEAGTLEFLREELDLDLEEIAATIEEVLA